MRFSTSSLGAAIALPALATATAHWNGTFHTAPGCTDAQPFFVSGFGGADCITPNTTFTSVSGYEDQPAGYCHFFLYSDAGCKTELDVYDTDKGECIDYAGIKSFRPSCYR